LGEYHLGVLRDTQRQAVEQHLAQCPHCRREVTELEGYLVDLARTPEPSPWAQAADRVRVVVATLIGGAPSRALGAFPLAPALDGVRGGAPTEPLVYQADEIQIILEIEPDDDRPDHKTILGLVMGLDRSPGGAKSDFTVQLRQGPGQVASTVVDELGNFVFSDVIPGEYELVLTGPGLKIRISHIQAENSAGDS
jgi:hypothetical protein